MSKYSYGWFRDNPDVRDMRLAWAPLRAVAALPRAWSWRKWGPRVYDQGPLGSCTGNGIARQIQFDQIKQGEKSWLPSRLMIYYGEREQEGTVPIDAGASPRDGFKFVSRVGVCPEYMWPYDVARFAERPVARAYRNAWRGKSLLYRSVSQTVDQLRAAIFDRPLGFGFTVYESFESRQVERDGVVPMPEPGERVVGGHYVVATGYDDASQRFEVANSWGEGWGDGGYCSMSYAYLTNVDLASDHRVIDRVQ